MNSPALSAQLATTGNGHDLEVLFDGPVAPDLPSYRFMGQIEWFERRQFDAVGKAGMRRHIMRLS